MKRLNRSVMTVAVVLALIAFVAPSSAVFIGNHDITLIDYDFDGTHSIYTYSVTSGSPALSHWSLSWCNEEALVGCSEELCRYQENDPATGVTGIKFDKEYIGDDTRTVSFKLLGEFRQGDVWVGTKADGIIAYGYVTGPIKCNEPIPEFSTIAIPIASILGLLFFFNHRKRRKEE